MCHIQRWQLIAVEIGGDGEGRVKLEAQAQILYMLQTWQSDVSPSQTQWEKRRQKGGKMTQWVMEVLKPTTGQMACHVLTNWATKSPGNSVTEFEYLKLSYQGSSQSGYQTGMFNGEGVVGVKRKAQAQIFNMLQTWQSDLTQEANQALSLCKCSLLLNHWTPIQCLFCNALALYAIYI